MDEKYQALLKGEGHTLFVLGEAGIGKTSLIRRFKENAEKFTYVLTGTCDSLITPRPLGPLYDISIQLSHRFQQLLKSGDERPVLYSALMEELKGKDLPVIMIIEDIHWADEATLDLVKFLSRRMETLNCLLILTYREDEIAPNHPIRKIYGEIPGPLYSRISLSRLSLEAVRELSDGTGFNPHEVYTLTGGNPFYVNEVLAWYSPGIPDNIKDSILGVFYSQKEEVRDLWELISVLPGKIDIRLLELIQPDFYLILDKCIHSGVLIQEENALFFKHELYRKTIEESLNPLRRIRLNERILEVLLDNKEKVDLSLIVHHGNDSKNFKIVAEYAPLAAEKAISHGAHLEAASLYGMALKVSEMQEISGLQREQLANLYEVHSYECYLTNQHGSAIDSQQTALEIWRESGDKIKIGTSLRILSRLNWFIGEKDRAEKFGLMAIEALENGFPLKERARAYSNYAQLKMLSGEKNEALSYGEKAVDLARKIRDEEILCHALNNVGTVRFMYDGISNKELQQSLEIGLKHDYQEHAARAYTNISCISIDHRKYEEALRILNEGIEYCRERDLDSWTYYMLAWKCRYHFEQCQFEEAERIGKNILDYEGHPPIVRIIPLTLLGRLMIRQGNISGIENLEEARELAITSGELQRIVPVTIAFLEYAWITKDGAEHRNLLKITLDLLDRIFIPHYYEELAYWMNKNGISFERARLTQGIFNIDIAGKWKEAAEKWKALGCRYEQALSLLNGTEDSRNKAFSILEELGLNGTLEAVKSKLRSKGIKKIPRGPRPSTKKNSANLTSRQIEVLKLIKSGLMNAEIAEKLFLSPKTVDHHISAILRKLEVNSRQKAVVKAQELGLWDVR